MSDSESQSSRLEKEILLVLTTSIVYKPEKILALKDIDPEERMNMVKAFVSAANTYRDGTYGAHGAAVPYRSSNLGATRCTAELGLTGVDAKDTSVRARSSSVVHRSATTREADAAQTCATTG